MNYPLIFYIMRILLLFEAGFLVPPMLISTFSGERQAATALLITICLILPLCLPFMSAKRPKGGFTAREGFAIVGVSWAVMSLFGALPFFLSGEIPNYIDAFFETVSGFTTTGASILTDIEGMSRGLLFWRSFTHWIGGMGVLVFLLAVVPLSEQTGGTSLHLMRAESPGPQVDKARPKMLDSAKILYLIYIALTLIELVLLLLEGMDLFSAACIAMGTAGTGGFGVLSDSIASYSPLVQWTVTVFMVLFGVNFNAYILLMARRFRSAMGEEVRTYLLIFGGGALIIAVDLIAAGVFAPGDALRHAAFQTASIMSTTGFATADFNLWPQLSRMILVVLTAVGACAGSTGGGFKISRILLLLKGVRNYLRKILHPREVRMVRLEGSVVDDDTVQGVFIYLVLYVLILIAGALLVSVDGFSFETSFSASLTCLNNVGPGMDVIGPMGGFAPFSNGTKVILSALMLIGRLEILPVLMLFNPGMWKKR